MLDYWWTFELEDDMTHHIDRDQDNPKRAISRIRSSVHLDEKSAWWKDKAIKIGTNV